MFKRLTFSCCLAAAFASPAFTAELDEAHSTLHVRVKY
jgi:hypothetical protein